MIKIAFFDIDGTLFDNANQKWKEKTIEAIKTAQSRGLKCVVCSARPYHSMKMLGTFDLGIEFDGWVGSCGAVASYHGEILRTAFVEKTVAERFIKKAKEDGFNLEVVGIYERTLLFPQTKESLAFYNFFKESIPSIAPLKGEPIVTMNFFAPKEIEAEYKKAFPELIINRYLDSAYDVMMRLHKKSEGMQSILDKLGLTKDEAIAFGDDRQDMDMIDAASTFVCMGQGKDEVKKIATYITKPVSEDGVYYGLRHYGLLGEDHD